MRFGRLLRGQCIVGCRSSLKPDSAAFIPLESKLKRQMAPSEQKTMHLADAAVDPSMRNRQAIERKVQKTIRLNGGGSAAGLF